MRQIVLDTETTGRDPQEGHRIIEIGAVVLHNRQITQDTFQVYLNPERESDPGAYAIHGRSTEFLKDKPLFSEVVSDFLAFVKGAELIIHNAPFDVGFLNYELQLLNAGYKKLENYCHITDSLLMARKLHPSQRNSLDALCKRYEIDNTHRSFHGALVDAKLLARVYLRMTSGQSTLFESTLMSTSDSSNTRLTEFITSVVHYANTEELSAHEERLIAIKKIAGECLWQDN